MVQPTGVARLLNEHPTVQRIVGMLGMNPLQSNAPPKLRVVDLPYNSLPPLADGLAKNVTVNRWTRRLIQIPPSTHCPPRTHCLRGDLRDLLDPLLPILRQILTLRHAPVLNDKTQAIVQAPLTTQPVLDNPLNVEPLDVIEKLSLDKYAANVELRIAIPNLRCLEELLHRDIAILVSNQRKKKVSVARWTHVQVPSTRGVGTIGSFATIMRHRPS